MSHHPEHCRACKGTGGNYDDVGWNELRRWVPCHYCAGTGKQEVIIWKAKDEGKDNEAISA